MSKWLQVIIPDEVEARLRETAARKGMTVAAWVRRAIDKPLAAKGTPIP